MLKFSYPFMSITSTAYKGYEHEKKIQLKKHLSVANNSLKHKTIFEKYFPKSFDRSFAYMLWLTFSVQKYFEQKTEFLP